ncbi:hypothetical protein FRB93_004978 [Tulasnella sp. JGI-2019a]|nr:hypothetical protein FRB93_004978 [Tulasnella sp. JGI-2019a]
MHQGERIQARSDSRAVTWAWRPNLTRIYVALGVLFQIITIAGGALWWNGHITIHAARRRTDDINVWVGTGHRPVCHPPLPPPVPLSSHDTTSLPFRIAARSLRGFLESEALQNNTDSLTVGVITPAGLIFNQAYGLQRANETHGSQKPLDLDSLYRIASVSKMFCVLELMILKEGHLVDWDDPVDRFLTNFTYQSDDWRHHLSRDGHKSSSYRPPITLRQLATHMSGIGRDFPPASVNTWPKLDPENIPVTNKSREGILKAISTIPLVVPQYTMFL